MNARRRALVAAAFALASATGVSLAYVPDAGRTAAHPAPPPSEPAWNPNLVPPVEPVDPEQPPTLKVIERAVIVPVPRVVTPSPAARVPTQPVGLPSSTPQPIETSEATPSPDANPPTDHVPERTRRHCRKHPDRPVCILINPTPSPTP